MRLTWTTATGDPHLQGPWNALVLKSHRPQVFYTWEWAAAVAHAYQSTLHPWIATAYDGEELVGVAALARPSDSEVAFLGGTTADYCDFVARPDKHEEFVHLLLGNLKTEGIERFVLANLPADSPTAEAIKADKTFHRFDRTGYLCAQVHMGLQAERHLLVQSLLRKKMFRRSINALQRIGPVTLRHDCGKAGESGALDAFCLNHVARFLAMGRLSNLVMQERRKFLAELTRLVSSQGWFDLMQLYAGEQLVASNYGFRFHGSWFWYQPTIVNRYEDLSPGFCLLTKIIEDASKESALMVDLGLGAEGYKERFSNAERRTIYVTLSQQPRDIWKARVRYTVAQGFSLHPRLETLARAAKQRLDRDVERARARGWRNGIARAGQKLKRAIASRDSVLLFRWPPDRKAPPDSPLALTWEILATAAMQYSCDRETLDYVLRATERFHAGRDRGFGFLDSDGRVLHFAWAAAYDQFKMAELDVVLQAPARESVMIFDCWTPRELRGQGHYARSIAALASKLDSEGSDVWIFSAPQNIASVAGIEKAGFQLQASLGKRRVLWWGRTRQVKVQTIEAVRLRSGPASAVR